MLLESGLILFGVWWGAWILLGGILWFRRGHSHPDTIPELMVLGTLTSVAATLLTFGVTLEESRITAMLRELGVGVIAGAVVGVVILVLTRDAH